MRNDPLRVGERRFDRMDAEDQRLLVIPAPGIAPACRAIGEIAARCSSSMSLSHVPPGKLCGLRNRGRRWRRGHGYIMLAPVRMPDISGARRHMECRR